MMPVYTVACRKSLSQETRAGVADAVTKTHCEVTGAPPEFVSVVFMDGHRIRGGRQVGVIGNVRIGGNRDDSLLNRLQTQIHTKVARAAGITEETMTVRLVGFPASWVMEGGMIMPDPGAEDEWLERQHGAPCEPPSG